MGTISFVYYSESGMSQPVAAVSHHVLSMRLFHTQKIINCTPAHCNVVVGLTWDQILSSLVWVYLESRKIVQV